MSKQLSLKFNLLTLCFGLFLSVFLNFSVARAQSVTPTPTPIVEGREKPTEESQKIDDAQNVHPENLQGVPKIAPNYESNERDFPELGRVGVDMMQQKPLTLREAITLALENNKDIEVTRQNVRISEFDLRAADGVYQPRFFAQTFYERSTTPKASAVT